MFGKFCCSVTGLFVLTLSFVVLLVATLLTTFLGIPKIIESVIAKQVHLEENTKQWDRFKELPVAFDIQVHFIHITNPDDILNGSLPDVMERGPYHYKQTISRRVISKNDTEDSVTFDQTKTITFDQESTGNLSESDVITVLNVPLLVVTQLTSTVELLPAVGCMDQIFSEEYNKLFLNLTVKTLVLEGFVFASLDLNPGPACMVVRDIVIQRASRMKNVEVIWNDKGEIQELRYAVLEFRIRNPDGIFTINRGRDDVSKLGNILKWNESTTLSIWGRQESINNDTCKRLRGTDSTLYHPKITKDEFFEIFSTDICRVMKVKYQGTNSYLGIDGYRFGIDNSTLTSATENPENDCYCTKSVYDGTGTASCFLDGIVDVMPCFNAPVLLSFPRFLYADDYRKGLTGLGEPDPSLHATYLLVEPNTGTPLQGFKRVQLNVVLRAVQNFPLTRNLSGTLLPLMWLDEGVNLSQDLVDELKSSYFNKLKLVDGLKYSFIAVFAACVCVSSIILIRKKWTQSK